MERETARKQPGLILALLLPLLLSDGLGLRVLSPAATARQLMPGAAPSIFSFQLKPPGSDRRHLRLLAAA
eukprot:10946879-Alexandrium_andersonii.AAC.1